MKSFFFRCFIVCLLFCLSGCGSIGTYKQTNTASSGTLTTNTLKVNWGTSMNDTLKIYGIDKNSAFILDKGNSISVSNNNEYFAFEKYDGDYHFAFYTITYKYNSQDELESAYNTFKEHFTQKYGKGLESNERKNFSSKSIEWDDGETNINVAIVDDGGLAEALGTTQDFNISIEYYSTKIYNMIDNINHS